ncbi:hypothetical protein Ancab_036466 [Ancistrocladus abbreviatus]
MAGSISWIVQIAIFFCFAVPSLATVYTVGDSSGWALGVDYGTWSSGKTFSVGGSLVFNYGSGHTVDEVIQSDYSACTVGNAITSDNTGSTTILLKTPGSHYFLCGVIGHCSSGMKLAVNVGGSSPTPAASPNSTSPPSNTVPTTTGYPTTITYIPVSSTESASSFAALFISGVVALLKVTLI